VAAERELGAGTVLTGSFELSTTNQEGIR